MDRWQASRQAGLELNRSKPKLANLVKNRLHILLLGFGGVVVFVSRLELVD